MLGRRRRKRKQDRRERSGSGRSADGAASADQIEVGELEVIRRVLTHVRMGLEDGVAPFGTCVQTCLETKYALQGLSIESELEAVALAVEAGDGIELRVCGPGDGPWYDGNRFNGHAVLFVPQCSTLVDPTLEQFEEVRECTGLPRHPIFELPAGFNNLGDEPLAMPIGERQVVYYPHSIYRNAWQHEQFGDHILGPILKSTGHEIAHEVGQELRR